MNEAVRHHKTARMPFLLKALAFFLIADGLFKMVAIFSGVVPGPEFFGYQSFYYYGLVAIIDFSLAVQVLGRASYSWILGVVFFGLQALVTMLFFVLASPLSWLSPGVLGRVQIILTVALYAVLARYMASRSVRDVLSPEGDKAE